MDFDSSTKFIDSLAKFLQSLCNGYVEFDKGVEVIGHIYLSVDSDTGKKIDYVLNEKVCKNDNSVTFISNSFHAQPAEKPKPLAKKPDADKQNEELVVMDDSGNQGVPSSTNVGTMGGMRLHGNQDNTYSPGSKRPRSPFNRRGGFGRGANSPAGRPGIAHRYDSGGASKISRTDNSYGYGEDYDGGYQEDDDYGSNFLHDDQSSQDIDQKPIIEPDISIVKEEQAASQQANTQFSSYNQPTGPGRGRSNMPPQSPYSSSSMLQNPPTPQSQAYDTYTGSSLEGADPSTWMSDVEYTPKLKRQRLSDGNQFYTIKEREEMTQYALTYGVSEAAKHYSNILGKRVPRSSIQNFVLASRRAVERKKNT